MAVIITPLIFGIEIVSNMIRPFTLGVRLFANMFADEQLAAQVSGLAPPYTQFLVPARIAAARVFRGICSDACVYAAVDDLYQRGVACPA